MDAGRTLDISSDAVYEVKFPLDKVVIGRVVGH